MLQREDSAGAARLETLRVAEVCDRPELEWAKGLSFRIPAGVVRRTGLDRGRLPAGEVIVTPSTGRPDAADVVALRSRAMYTARPASARLPFSYRRVPDRIRSFVAGTMGRWQRSRTQRWAAFPQWPLDLSVDFLSDLADAPRAVCAAGQTPVILSHDLDSPEGLRNIVRRFLPLEEEFGARSTNFVVPCAWPLEYNLLRELAARGHELGIHGYDHSNQTPFVSPAERRQRLDAVRALVAKFHMTGYRAPSLVRTPELLADLTGRFGYDSSIPTAGGLFPVPNNGCATARPFRIGSIIEIPLSLPRDGSLRFLGFSADEIAACWTTLAETISRSRGVVVLLTHGEERFSGNPAMLGAYRKFLSTVAESGNYRWTTARELASEIMTSCGAAA